MRNQTRGFSALMFMLVLWGSGCPHHVEQGGYYPRERERLARLDDFDMLLTKAGLAEDELPTGDTLTLGQANDLLLLLRFKISDGNMVAYGPRVLASFLLEETIQSGGSLSRHALTEGLHRYGHLVVLSPEGHLVRAYSGSLLSCVGPLRVRNGVPGTGPYRVNAFYVQNGDSFREEPYLTAPAIFVLPEARRPLERVAGGKR